MTRAGARTGPCQHDQVNARRDCFLERYGSSADRQSAAPKRDGCEDSNTLERIVGPVEPKEVWHHSQYNRARAKICEG